MGKFAVALLFWNDLRVWFYIAPDLHPNVRVIVLIIRFPRRQLLEHLQLPWSGGRSSVPWLLGAVYLVFCWNGKHQQGFFGPKPELLVRLLLFTSESSTTILTQGSVRVTSPAVSAVVVVAWRFHEEHLAELKKCDDSPQKAQWWVWRARCGQVFSTKRDIHQNHLGSHAKQHWEGWPPSLDICKHCYVTTSPTRCHKGLGVPPNSNFGRATQLIDREAFERFQCKGHDVRDGLFWRKNG